MFVAHTRTHAVLLLIPTHNLFRPLEGCTGTFLRCCSALVGMWLHFLLLLLLLRLVLVRLLRPAGDMVASVTSQVVLSDQRATLPENGILATTYLDGGLFSSVARTGTVHERTGAVVLMPRTRN